jgi:hypothetical protein
MKLIFYIVLINLLSLIESTRAVTPLDSYDRSLQGAGTYCQAPDKCFSPKKNSGCADGDLESGPSAAVSAFAVIITMLLIAFAPCPCDNRVQRGAAAVKAFSAVAEDAISEMSDDQQLSLINTMGADSTVAKKIYLANSAKDLEDDAIEFELHREADEVIDKLDDVVAVLESKREAVEATAKSSGSEEEARRIRAAFEAEVAAAEAKVEEERTRQALKLQSQLEKRRNRKEKEARLVQEGSDRAKQVQQDVQDASLKAAAQAATAEESRIAAIAAKKREFDARLAAESDRTADKIAALKAQFDIESQQYSYALDGEKARQEAKLAVQIEQRREKARLKKAKEEETKTGNQQSSQSQQQQKQEKEKSISSASVSPAPLDVVAVNVIQKKGTGGTQNGTQDYSPEVLAILGAVLSEPQFAKLMAQEERKWWQRGGRYTGPSTDALLAEAEAERKAQEDWLEVSKKAQQDKLQAQLEARKAKKMLKKVAGGGGSVRL